MLTCKAYIFKLTSGQLRDAGRLEKFQAWQHRLICRRCRTFTVNDGKLDEILTAYKAELLDAASSNPPAKLDGG